MIPLLIVLAVLLLIALMRVGVRAQYGEDGFFLWARIFAFSIQVIPADKDKPKKEKKKKPKKEKPKEEKKKGGPLPDISVILKTVKDVLGRLRRKLSIDHMTVHYVSAAEDPFDAAMNVGRASAGAAIVLDAMDKVFKIRKYDITTDVDFSGRGDSIFLDAQLTLAIWEIIYIALGAMPLINAILKNKDKINHVRGADGKVDHNGKTPDK